MNSLRNKVQLIGRLGQDPKLTNLDNNKKVVNLSIATNETYTNNEGKKVENVQWHNVVAWGKKAEIIEQYMTKGEEIAIQGKLVNDHYVTKEGEKRLKTKIELTEFLFLGSKKNIA